MFLQSYSVAVKEIMDKDIFFSDHKDDIQEVMDYIFKNNKKEVLVLKNKDLIGIVTIKDLYKILGKNISKLTIEEIMAKEIISVTIDETLYRVRSLMIENKIGRIPVFSNKKLVGIIREESMRDFFYKGVDEAEEAIQHIFDNIHEALCVLDNKGRVILWNKRSESLYGVKEEEIKGKYLKDHFPNAIDLKVFDTKESVKNLYHSPKEGYHVIISASPIFINGKLHGVVSTEKDISEIEELQIELKKAKDRLVELQKQIKNQEEDPFDRIIGHSKKIIGKKEIARQIAKTNVSVLITGESGTGKEEFAKAIHKHSGVTGNFVPVNCSAIPNELFESEFFGYEKGAFTGARKEGKLGFFEQANGGTLFLDEIGDMPISMQAKLLRVLQDKKIKKVGGEAFIPVNVRIISATNKNLLEMVKENSFREELYYRINVIGIELPSLKERKEDIVLFVDHFLKEICTENKKVIPKIHSDVMNFLVDYLWKGNIRELKNVVEYMAIMCKGDIITKELIPKYMIEESLNIKLETPSLDLNQTVELIEITMIKKALKEAEGNRLEASRLLNIPRTTLHSKMKKYNLYDYL
ncbi:sigma 54-interacting transcriptional regulator [Tissierella sp. MSJ-40]|uniref:Sigma 54-interacting transcriptional regulator n=1 Tax=Tissierella simiarum TaxID=2841534 RepID=A0ABS6E4F4_9FIRM|nr:sigma-54 dependent transcriptional regulator PrdR [Tissierella simiarum]MBU5437788.1 sigma 54-interacting transcriptional regulator [Tissierella simiarum]